MVLGLIFCWSNPNDNPAARPPPLPPQGKTLIGAHVLTKGICQQQRLNLHYAFTLRRNSVANAGFSHTHAIELCHKYCPCKEKMYFNDARLVIIQTYGARFPAILYYNDRFWPDNSNKTASRLPFRHLDL